MQSLESDSGKCRLFSDAVQKRLIVLALVSELTDDIARIYGCTDVPQC